MLHSVRILNGKNAIVATRSVDAGRSAEAAQAGVAWFFSDQCTVPAPMSGAPYHAVALSPGGKWMNHLGEIYPIGSTGDTL